MVKDFWNCFQIYLGNSKLPNFLVDILKKTGYDSPISIELLDGERINEIEIFIESNYGCAHSLLKETIYENKENFKFLPGHLTLLAGLKTYATKFIESGLKKQKSTFAAKFNRGRELSTISEEIEVLSPIELEILKSGLVKKIGKFCRKYNINAENISIDSVGDCEIIINTNGQSIIKTTFACPVCNTTVPCICNQYWQVSNLEKHIKTHQIRKVLPGAALKLGQILNGTTADNKEKT